jgi:ribose transport system substrate-binding protein
MEKKILAVLIGVVLVATFAFDGGGSGASGAEKEKYVIGYDIYFEGNAWSLQMAEEFKYATGKYKDLIEKVYYTSAEFDITKQVSNLEDLMTKGCDIIFFSPLTPDSVVDLVKEAEAEGIRTIPFAIGMSGEDYTAYVNVDDYEHGRVMAEWLVNELNGKGKVAMISGIAGSATAIDCAKGARSVFDKHPDIDIVQEVFTGWDYSKTKIVTQDLLQAYPGLNGIWTHSEPRACAEVFIEGGKPFIPITWMGENGSLGVWKEYKDQGLEAQAFTKPPYISAVALDVGMAALTGKPFEKVTKVPVHIITEEELDKYYRPDLSEKFWTATYLPEEQIKKVFPK